MISFRTFPANLASCACFAWLLLASPSAHADLKPETAAAYQKYLATLSARSQASAGFLWIDADAGRRQSVRQGNIITQQVKTVSLPNGMIQHWIAGVFLPGVTLDQVERADQDFGSYEKIYAPDVSRVKLLSRDGNHFVVAYRITKTKVLTAVLDTVHAIDYQRLPGNRLTIRSHSQSVRQVEDVGKPTEHDLAEGEGSGFLWAMDSFWRMEERDGGVYMECEAVTLSRGVPFGLGGLVNPILQSFAEDALQKTIAAKKQAVMGSH